MSEANFIYNGNQTLILCKENDSLKEVIQKFKNKKILKIKKYLSLQWK